MLMHSYRALEQKAAVDAALAELEEQRQMFLTADRKLQEERMQADRNASKAPAVRLVTMVNSLAVSRLDPCYCWPLLPLNHVLHYVAWYANI